MEEIIKTCPECGNKLYHNKGISKKTGKPYENWKCGDCEYIKWADSPEPVLKSDELGQEANYKNLEIRVNNISAFLGRIREAFEELED